MSQQRRITEVESAVPVHRNVIISRQTNRLLLALGFVVLVAGSLATAGNAARATSTQLLVLSGGINATFKLDPATCAAGPGDMITVNAGSGGGWDALNLTAFDPKAGRRGTPEVELDEAGHTKAPYAVADWTWLGRKNGRHISQPVNVSSNGQVGAFNVVLAVTDDFDGPKTKPVKVVASWGTGTCKG